MTQQEYKKKLTQNIQIHKHKVFYDDEERKEFIKSRFGVDSTTKLSIDNLKLLLDYIHKRIPDIPILDKVKGKDLITHPQKEKIRMLWKQKAKDKSETALLNFASKILNYKTSSLDNLLKGKATKLIVALNKMT
jgi:hypothetical protein